MCLSSTQTHPYLFNTQDHEPSGEVQLHKGGSKGASSAAGSAPPPPPPPLPALPALSLPLGPASASSKPPEVMIRTEACTLE